MTRLLQAIVWSVLMPRWEMGSSVWDTQKYHCSKNLPVSSEIRGKNWTAKQQGEETGGSWWHRWDCLSLATFMVLLNEDHFLLFSSLTLLPLNHQVLRGRVAPWRFLGHVITQEYLVRNRRWSGKLTPRWGFTQRDTPEQAAEQPRLISSVRLNTAESETRD